MNKTSHRVLLWNKEYEHFNSNPKKTSFFKDDSLNHPIFFWEFQVIGLHWLKKEKKAAKARIILLGWSSPSLPVNWPRLPVSFTHVYIQGCHILHFYSYILEAFTANATFMCWENPNMIEQFISWTGLLANSSRPSFPINLSRTRLSICKWNWKKNNH